MNAFRLSPALHRFLFALSLSLLLVAPAAAKTVKMKDIPQTVASTVILSKVAAMLQAAELTQFLSGKGPLTFFAPTNSAFAKLPPGTYEALLRPENKLRLQHIVLYHIINDGKKWPSMYLMKVKVLRPCEGSPLPIKMTKATTRVGTAKVVHSDIRCENGIIHQIDTLLMPPEATMPPLIMAPPLPVGEVAVPNAPRALPVDVPNASSGTSTNSDVSPSDSTNVPPPADIH